MKTNCQNFLLTSTYKRSSHLAVSILRPHYNVVPFHYVVSVNTTQHTNTCCGPNSECFTLKRSGLHSYHCALNGPVQQVKITFPLTAVAVRVISPPAKYPVGVTFTTAFPHTHFYKWTEVLAGSFSANSSAATANAGILMARYDTIQYGSFMNNSTETC